MSGSKANSFYKRLLHRSLNKSTKAHLMKVCDPGHRDLHTSYDTAEGSKSMPLSHFILVSAGAEGTFSSKPTDAEYINFILQARDTRSKAAHFNSYSALLDQLVFYCNHWRNTHRVTCYYTILYHTFFSLLCFHPARRTF